MTRLREIAWCRAAELLRAAGKAGRWTRLVAIAASVLAVAMWLGGVSTAIGRASRLPSGASIDMPATVRDLGILRVGEERRVAFPVHNAGTQRLVLNEVAPGCDCGDHQRRTIMVAPGETVQIPVALDARQNGGAIESSASFTTNDPARPRLTLSVRAVRRSL